jgi:hypothetical protein
MVLADLLVADLGGPAPARKRGRAPRHARAAS